MNFMIRFTAAAAITILAGCPKADTAVEKKPSKVESVDPPRTAMDVISKTHRSLKADCGEDLHEMDLEGISGLEVPEANREEAESLLEEIGLFAQQCASYSPPAEEAAGTCNPDCSWCPIKWYWCIENAGACAGGDNKSCCKLGACGSKHHCRDVCKSSCGCEVPPLPPDSGGGGDDD